MESLSCAPYHSLLREHSFLHVSRLLRSPWHRTIFRQRSSTESHFTAATTSGTQFKMIFTADGKMTRQPHGKSGKRSSGTWKLDTRDFARLGKVPKPTAIQSSRAAKISGRFKRVPPLLQCGQNSSFRSLDRRFGFLVLSRALGAAVIRLVWVAPSSSAEEHCPFIMQAFDSLMAVKVALRRCPTRKGSPTVSYPRLLGLVQ
jgi:hypothetical protein